MEAAKSKLHGMLLDNWSETMEYDVTNGIPVDKFDTFLSDMKVMLIEALVQ